jgi:glycosyltransferase involved in cell wall biosynthesis
VVGGAEIGIHEIYHRLGRDHDVTILTPPLSPALLATYGADDYVSDRYRVVHIYPMLERRLPALACRALRRTSLLYVAALASAIRSDRPDVINFHFVRPHGGALIMTQRLHRVPSVLSLVGRLDVMRLLPSPQRIYAKMIVAQADLTLPNSSYYLGTRSAGSNIRVIPYGVDAAQFSPSRRSDALRDSLGLTSEHFALVCVQRLSPVKRVDMLIRAMAEIVPRNPLVTLIIGGQGEEEPRLRELVAELDLTDHVRFAGYISSDDLPAYFASADAFAFHSVLETFGIVFAQAMASGLPIVAARTSCVPDVLTPENGLLVEPFDVEAFADAVLTLARDRHLARQIGAHNRERATREMDWNHIAAQYERALADAAA